MSLEKGLEELAGSLAQELFYLGQKNREVAPKIYPGLLWPEDHPPTFVQGVQERLV